MLPFEIPSPKATPFLQQIEPPTALIVFKATLNHFNFLYYRVLLCHYAIAYGLWKKRDYVKLRGLLNAASKLLNAASKDEIALVIFQQHFSLYKHSLPSLYLLSKNLTRFGGF